jgi:hypothetical protein
MFGKKEARVWPVSLPQIETTVSAYLGPAECPETNMANALVDRSQCTWQNT